MIAPDPTTASVTAAPEPDPAILDSNLETLRKVSPHAAELLVASRPPDSLASAVGRDGETTLTWTEADGTLRWLGHTTMPSISCAAIADAFQPGSGNVLLFGFGQGGEVRRLLDRLAVHQAVFVVDPCGWGLAAALRLRDFASDILNQRLLVFVGDDAWDDCRDFLTEASGFLVPQRVLSWPWFDQESVALVSRQLTDIQTAVASNLASASSEPPPPVAVRSEPAIAIVSNVPHDDIRRLAARLSWAAEDMGAACERFVLDDPARVQPLAIESALQTMRPDVTILIDVAPSALHHALPDSPAFVLCSHSQPLSEAWLATVPPNARLGVRNPRQRAQALAAGVSDTRLTLIAPAAAACPTNRRRKTPIDGSLRVLLLGDAGDITAESIGLHLRSHRRLWATATGLINQRIDSYGDENAPEILAAAERALDIRLDSDEVRRGLTDRIQTNLGPALVRRAFALALSRAGIAFDVNGAGWATVAELAAHGRPAPEPCEAVHRPGEYDLLVSLETSGLVRSDLLDGLAAGAAGLVRRNALDATPDGLAAVLDIDRHVSRFTARDELEDLVRRCKKNPSATAETAAATAEHLNATHTWQHRLRSILDA